MDKRTQKKDATQFFMGVLYKPQVSEKDIADVLEDGFGALEATSDSTPFHQTRYYEKEMGSGLKRIFFSFQKLVCPSQLARIKEDSCQMEEAFFTVSGKRFVNLDPGILDAVKVVLASTKHGGHKIALTKNIYADMILDYYQGNFRAFEWTFPDFKSGVYFPFFEKMRESYLRKIKEGL